MVIVTRMLTLNLIAVITFFMFHSHLIFLVIDRERDFVAIFVYDKMVCCLNFFWSISMSHGSGVGNE